LRGSRTVPREAAGAIPSAYSPARAGRQVAHVMASRARRRAVRPSTVARARTRVIDLEKNKLTRPRCVVGSSLRDRFAAAPGASDRPKTATVPSQWITAAYAHHTRPVSFADTKDTAVLMHPQFETGQASADAPPVEPKGYLGSADISHAHPRKAKTTIKCSPIHIPWISRCSRG
jgi:hypothetical protein